MSETTFYVVIAVIYIVTTITIYIINAKRSKANQWKNKKTGEIYRIYAMSINTTNSRDGEEEISYYKKGCDPRKLLFNRNTHEFYTKFEKEE